MENKKVLLGMSGGVDSSVAAILLKKSGYEVIGATMKLWEDEELVNSKFAEDAKKVCNKLKIPHYVFDFREKFNKYVIQNFINCYKCGKTPNPCVNCNKHLKFNYFYQKAQELKCNYIATGHYAKTEYNSQYRRYVLKKSNIEKKDQTYFLYGMSREILKYILFPLAEYKDKIDIRKIAEEYNLETAEKPDSQEICFIPNDNYIKYIIDNTKTIPANGNIILSNGTILGKHNGTINYTIGQRKGLGLSYEKPLYVIKIDYKKNEIIVGEEKELYSDQLFATNLNWLAIDELKEPMVAKAKIRYRAEESKCIIIPENTNKIKVKFEEKQRAITSGQSVVFYKDDIVIGGGIII